MKQLELAVVMPVYNEAKAIEAVVKSWAKVLDEVDASWQLHLYDDGSVDDSLARIRQLAEGDPRIIAHHHSNRGHGPTVIEAYKSLSETEWIFQVDSDDEVPAQAFRDLWERRKQYDFLIGERVYQERPPSRRLVSLASRVLVQILFGSGVHDVNAPFRLMRAAAFRPLFEAFGARMFSPNLIITGAAACWDLRVCRLDVPYQFRRTGQVSIRKGKLLRAALRSFWQTVYFRVWLFPRLRKA